MGTLIVGVIVAIVTAVLGAFLGTLGGIFLEKRRSGDEDRRRHVDNVRAEVLDPLIQRIESYCLPIYRGQRAPVELTTVRQSGPIGHRDTWDNEWVEDFVPLKVVTLGCPGSSTASEVEELRDLSHGRLNSVLYPRDCS